MLAEWIKELVRRNTAQWRWLRSPTTTTQRNVKINRSLNLQISESLRSQVVGLSEELVQTVDDVLHLIATGNNVRTSGTTSANQCSSRSHAIFQIILKKKVSPTSTKEKLHGMSAQTIGSLQLRRLWVDYRLRRFAVFLNKDLALCESFACKMQWMLRIWSSIITHQTPDVIIRLIYQS